MYFFEQGFFHVLDRNAYDHILFLIVLLIVYAFSDWINAVYLITLFTIGHSLTLLLSTYNIIRVNADYVQFLIPLTILIVAIICIFGF